VPIFRATLYAAIPFCFSGKFSRRTACNRKRASFRSPDMFAAYVFAKHSLRAETRRSDQRGCLSLSDAQLPLQKPAASDLRIGRLHSNRISNRIGRRSDGRDFYSTYLINLCNAIVQAYRMSCATLRELRVMFVTL